MNPNIEIAIRVLERTKRESREFQDDALWHIGDYLADAIDRDYVLNENELFDRLKEHHEAINKMIAES